MSNIEHALITRVIDDQDFHSLEKARIDESFFSSPEAREAYNVLREFYYHPATVGHVPSRDLIKMRVEGFYPLVAPDPVPVLAQQLRYEKLRMDLLQLSAALQAQAEASPMEALATLRTESAKIATVADSGSYLSLSSAYNMLLERYETVENAGGVIGIPYPWHPVNEETQGMQGSQFIVLYGRPKSMKSWVAVDMACHAYSVSRRRVLFYTREMSPELVTQRVAARLARVDYKAFKNGTLRTEVKDHVFLLLRELAEAETSAGAYGFRQPFFVVISDRSASSSGESGGVGWLRSKIRELQPDIVFVDGMYLMRDDRSNIRTADWKSVTNISRDLKGAAQEFDIPVIGVTQATRAAEKTKGEDMTELAYADAIGQDSDAVFRVRKKIVIGDDKVKRTELLLNSPGLREGTFDGIVISGQPATSFDYLRTLTQENEDEKAKEEYAATNRDTGGSQYRRASFNARIPVR